jgi:hypothetical protein
MPRASYKRAYTLRKVKPMPRITWTEPDCFGPGVGLRHGMTVPKEDVDQVVGELKAAGMRDVHIVMPEEVEKAWRTNPARKVNGGNLTDEQFRARFVNYDVPELVAKMASIAPEKRRDAARELVEEHGCEPWFAEALADAADGRF